MTAEQFMAHQQDMTADQRVRAVAIQSAAAFCAPATPIEDVLFAADVFAGYIEGGWQRALQVHSSGNTQEQPDVQSVELREQATPEAPASHEEQPPKVDAPAPPEQSPPSSVDEHAEVIPLAARGTVSKKQTEARRIIDRNRRERAKYFLNQAKVAKAQEHKMRLLDEVAEAQLDDFVMEIDGRMQKLGAYIRNLYGC